MPKQPRDTYTGYALIRQGIQSLYNNGVDVEDLYAEVNDAFEAHIVSIAYGTSPRDSGYLDEEIEQEYIASEEVPF
jgi:hypothetical protein